jgi:hypothetical protein
LAMGKSYRTCEAALTTSAASLSANQGETV